jgi:UDP-N-acetylmuramoyl-tripeptide--D-alanyl-D-alanine ligase
VTPENYNTTLGVVRTLRENLRPWHEVFVCEMGARNVGDIREICELVKPVHGVITSIGPQHLESFGSMENVVRAKFELADALPDEGVVFLNADNTEIRTEWARRGKDGKRRLTWGFADDCDYRVRDVRTSREGTSFFVKMPDAGEIALETTLLGGHNVQNIVGAVAVADFLGVDRKDIVVGVRRLEGVPHRLQLIRGGRDVIIDDAYNSNASGARAALDVLALFDGFKVLITPGMVELGTLQDELNESFGAQAAAVCDFVVLVGRRQAEGVLTGLRKAHYPGDKTFVAEDLSRGLAKVSALDAGGRQKVILLENDLPDNFNY